MDATSPELCSEPAADLPYARRLLLEAPVLPYALTVLASTWLGLHGRAGDLGGIWPWTLVVLGLGLCAHRRRSLGGHGRFATWGWLTVIAGVALAAGIQGRPPQLERLRPASPVVVEGVVASHPRGRDGERWLWLRAGSVAGAAARVAGTVDVLVGLPEGALPDDASFEPPAWGQRVRLKGYLKRSQLAANGFEMQEPPWRLELASWRFWDVVAPPPTWQLAAGELRADLAARLGCGDGRCSPGAELRQALLLGAPDGLPERWRRVLRATGLGHLLAVSGLHVGLVAGLVWLAAMPLGRRARLLLALAAVAAYLLLVGPRPSAVRAAGMAGIVALASLAGRPPQALNAAALWAASLVLWQPQLLDDLGFQLSVAATIGILVLAPPFATSLASLRWRDWWVPRGLASALAVCLAAQLSTLPLLAPWTGLAHPLGACLNLLAVPWLALFLGLSFLGLVPLAAGVASADRFVVGVLDLLALPLDALSGLPPSPAWAWPWLPSTKVACVVAAAGCLVLLRPRAAGRCLLVVWLLAQTGGPSEVRQACFEHVEFHRLDVGQGDALLLRDGAHAVLVDGGGWRRGDVAARVLVPALAHRSVRRLDAVVLTHPDADHCHGLRDLLDYLPVAEVWSSAGWHETCALELLARRGPAWRVLWRGDSVRSGRWRFEVLWPPAGLRPADGRGGNDHSLVLHVAAGGRRILLAGDVGERVERRLVSMTGDALRAGVLGVPHHGSKTSTSSGFLDAVSPRLASVGVGASNPYGHPHPTVLDRLRSAEVIVHRTDLMGALELRWPCDAESTCTDLQ